MSCGYDAPKRAFPGGTRSFWRAAARRAANVSRRRMDRRAAEDDVAGVTGKGDQMEYQMKHLGDMPAVKSPPAFDGNVADYVLAVARAAAAEGAAAARRWA